ncbi:MAG: GntR family transcriptional regulator [Bauldia sp.]|uniref:GntR family transcriptional regulator n=1 Tax=Bauldia sp. TaxID=2575872 RepID=UPI001D50CCA1|nr:GntR family transcriptional regulator [Bauldia sp.]MCB1495358.1 GntR family transcriptional regulator [Bauldia sp.]
MPDPASPSALQAETAHAIVGWVVQNELPAGYHLKEQHLGSMFRLSRSPVRGALNLLRRHGIVEQRPERGFFLSISGRDLGESAPLLPASGSDELYRVIATDWYNGEIADSVTTAELLRRYGGRGVDVGRVLKRLADDGVITRLAGKGWRLGPNLATARAFYDSYRFRLTIEPAAILLDTFELNQRLAARSRRRHEELLARESATVAEMVDADLEFHHLIGASCGNEFFAQAIERQNLLRRLTEILTTPDSRRLRISCEEHIAILEALAGGRREVAAALMREHLTISQEFAPEFFDPLPEGRGTGSGDSSPPS